MKSQFVFKDILRLVSGAKAAGVRGLVTSTNDGIGIADAVIKIVGIDKTTVCDESGRYELKPVASGTYSIEVRAPGFVTQTIVGFVISVGVVSTLDVVLVVV